MTKKEITSVAAFTLFIFILFLYLQSEILFSPDVSYLMHAANQLLKGGHYGTEIFETNPPMILYLYSPIWLFKKILSIHVITIAKIYISSLMLIASVISLVLLKQVLGNAKDYYLSTFFCGILFVLFILPIASFAQREHLLFIFMLPYLLMTALRLDGKSVNSWLAVGVGLFAGFGFALKPYFLVTLCLLELLFMVKKHKFFAWMRVESLIIFSVLIGYLGVVVVFQPDYLKIVLPLVSKYYFSSVKQTWLQILSNHYVLFCFMMALLYPFFRKYDKYSNLGDVVYFALLGMIIAFIIPQNTWYYHVYPAFALAFLLMIHCFAQQLLAEHSKKAVFMVLAMLVMSLFPLFPVYKIFHYCLDINKNNSANGLPVLFNHLAGDHSINCFTAAGTSSCFPMVFEINRGYYQARFPFFWWYQGLLLAENKAKNSHELSGVTKDREYLISAIAEDLNRYQPRWVVVDVKSFKYKEKNSTFDFIAFLSMNNTFRAAWRNYAFYVTIDNYDVYLRKS